MKLKKGINMVQFLNRVKTCRLEVLFETQEGDSLNLKSVLSQYLFTLIDPEDALLENGRLICEERDYEKLKDYLE